MSMDAGQDEAPLLLCVRCQYDLRGNSSNRCPECGTVFDPAVAVVSRLPWVHRAKIGWVKAFVGTVWWLTYRPRRLAEEIGCPHDIADGRAFRRVVLSVVVLALLFGVPMLYTSHRVASGVWRLGGDYYVGQHLHHYAWNFIPEPWSIITDAISLALIVALASRALGLLFLPLNALDTPRIQRLRALSPYCAAPIVFLGIAIVLASVYPLIDILPNSLSVTLGAIAICLFLISFGTAIGCVYDIQLKLLRHGASCSAMRTFIAGIGIQVLWIIGGAMLASLPLAFAELCWMIYYSLS